MERCTGFSSNSADCYWNAGWRSSFEIGPQAIRCWSTWIDCWKTGSGKSEPLLTLLGGLALNHHPHQLQFLLVDYEGGTAMSAMRALPHTSGMVTDFDGRRTIRTLKMLGSEMQRRELIRIDARVADIDKYHRAGLKFPFPNFFVIIDEFAELRDRLQYDLDQVMNQFISVAKKGRALGVPLIIAMQKPEGVVNDRVRANMKLRVCLRVERVEDNRNAHRKDLSDIWVPKG